MATALVDPHNRTVRDLRISITDRCNFRCTYCMPQEGMRWLPRSELLTFEEIERIARLCVERFGFDSIRLTGGEPTVRADLPVLVTGLSALGVDLALTTNGATLARLAGDLQRAGLRRINISLDTLRRDRFCEIIRRDALDDVLAGIDAARHAGLAPIKLNCVLVRGVNDDEILDFAQYGRERGLEVRFIEWMPLDGGGSWTADRVVPARSGPSIRSQPAAPLRPTRGPTVTVAAGSGSSPASPRPFVRRATGSVSRRKVSCVTAFFRFGRRTCGPSCAPAGATTRWPRRSKPKWVASGPVTPSGRCTSFARRAA